MPVKLSIKPEYDVTVADLINLHKSGHSVFRTSHAGNWNSYKLLLSELGLPDCVWDVTCMHRDVNNQPQKQLIDGGVMPLLDEKPEKPSNGEKHLTPYQRCCNGTQTLSSYHLEPLKKLYGDLVRTQSELLLEYEENLTRMFKVAEEHAPEMIGRYVLPCGCMVTLKQESSGTYRAQCRHNTALIKAEDLAQSAIDTLHELKQLVTNPKGYLPKGGALYSFDMVVASFLLWSYWKFGNKAIYMLSGPDMIEYATKEGFVDDVGRVLTLMRKHVPDLVPDTIDVRIVPTALFCFGYPSENIVAKNVMRAHKEIISLQNQLVTHGVIDPNKPRTVSKKLLTKVNGEIEEVVRTLENDGVKWNIFHNPARDVFFTQHDLHLTGGTMAVHEEHLGMSFRDINMTLTSLQKMEKLLISQFCPKT